MRRALRSFLVVAALLGVTHRGAAAEDHNEQVLRDLLARPAPPPPWEAISEATRRPRPSRPMVVPSRLWDHPEHLPRVLSGLPRTPDVIARVAAAYEADRKAPTWEEPDRQSVHLWLLTESDQYRGELPFVAARNLRAAPEHGVEGEEALELLMRRDWPAAREILVSRRADRESAVRAYALLRLYAHASPEEAEGLRTELRLLATSRSGTAYERWSAMRALSASPWPGDVAFYLGLFHDETIRELRADNRVFHPLEWLVAADPDAWIPRIVPFVDGPDRAAHDNAVACLVQFHAEKFRADALQRLLPWLEDPAWSSSRDRLRLIQGLDDLVASGVSLREHVPALVHIVREGDKGEMQGAADALAKVKDPSAIPALRSALAELRDAPRAGDPWDARTESALFLALRTSGGLPDEVVVGWIEAFAAYDEAAGPPSQEVRLGRRCTSWFPDRVLARAEELAPTRPEVAARLRGFVEASWAIAGLRRLLARLSGDSLDADGVLRLLESRERIWRDDAKAVEGFRAGGGFAGGVAAVLAGEIPEMVGILGGEDATAKRALLACARLERVPLPVSEVVPLLQDANLAVAEAADRFLEAEDSPAARSALLARSPGQARVLGTGPWRAFEALEKELRDEVLRDGGPEEIVALLTSGFGGRYGHWIVRRHGGAAELERRSPRGEASRSPLSPDSRRTLWSFLAAEGVDDLPPYTPDILDGTQFTYLHLTRAGGRRLFMNNPGVGFRGMDDGEDDVYARLVRVFLDLAASTER